MKNLLTALALMIVLAATAASVNIVRAPKKKIEKVLHTDSVVVKKDSVLVDSLVLPLNKIPKAQNLYTVAKKSVGKWAKLFIAIKIEESGADGKNSFYALKYNNLTGMRYPGKGRATTSTGSGYDSYAIFNNWHDCMLDFKFYIDIIEAKFVAKYNRQPKDEYEMVNFMHGSFNVYQKWRLDMIWLLGHCNYK